MNKRYGNKWSASIGGAYTSLLDFVNGVQQNPNQPREGHRSTYNFKASGSYDGPWGVRLSPVVRFQSGANFARTLTLSSSPATGVSIAGTTIYAGPTDEFREDNVTVVDVRAEKRFKLGNRARLQVMFDGFNLMNSHAAETLSRATNPQFLKPTAILAPITGRLGFRISY
jgi:hypothetical protein